jgi:hypothetical protein
MKLSDEVMHIGVVDLPSEHVEFKLFATDSLANAVVKLAQLAQSSRVYLTIDLLSVTKLKVGQVKVESEWFPTSRK